jgi:hypothetical protein
MLCQKIRESFLKPKAIFVSVLTLGTSMASQRWRKEDQNIEGENRTFEDWTRDWWQWSHSLPNNLPPANHPLKSDGTHAHLGQLSRSSYNYHQVWFCGGYWESESQNSSRDFTLPNNSKDCSMLFAVVVSGIAEDEFKPPFLPVKPTAEDKINAACRVITDPTTTANILIKGPGFEERLHKNDLDLIIPNSLVRVWPSSGFEINGHTGPIDLGTAGYWFFLKGPLQSGRYIIKLEGEAPMFGSQSDSGNTERYKLSLTYHITVPG